MIKLLLRLGVLLAVFVAAIRPRKSPPLRSVARATPSEETLPAREERSGLKRWLLTLAALLFVLALGGFLVAASGIIPLKASAGHWAITRWFLEFSKHRSIATYTIGLETPALDEPWMVLKGAGHFETGCSPCHGSPRQPQPRVAQQMLPMPPRMQTAVPEWEPDELFLIIKHGIKFAGMPAWPALQRDDEVWAMVAFLQRLPALSAEEYTRLASGEMALTGGAPIRDLLEPRTVPRLITESCGRCHGADGLGRGLGAFPKLAGQKPGYLLASLQAYDRRQRHSGIMGPIAAGLSPEAMRELALYYGNLPTMPPVQPNGETASMIELGEKIVHRGIQEQGVPACVACHGPGGTPRNPIYPVLAGQYADYLVLQLQLFKAENRGGTPYAHIMRLVAGQLTEEQMRAVAQYYASLTPANRTATRGTDGDALNPELP